MVDLMGFNGFFIGIHPLVNLHFDPENHQFLEETNLPAPMTTRVYANLLEGSISWEYNQQ